MIWAPISKPIAVHWINHITGREVKLLKLFIIKAKDEAQGVAIDAC